MDEGLFVPTGLMEPMREGLQRLRDAVGDPVAFLAKELQLTEEEIKDGRFMGAQVESIAAAIWNIKDNNKGTIIADDTAKSIEYVPTLRPSWPCMTNGEPEM